VSGTGGISRVGDTRSAGLKLGLVLGEWDNGLLVIDGVLESEQVCG
jgi:hypothetical protein